MPMKSLKKTSKIDLENEDLVIEDESRAQNTTNSTRCFCSPIIDGVKDKKIFLKKLVIDLELMQLVFKA